MNSVFVTLFNSSYLLQGITLVDSLLKNYPESRIYIASLDDFATRILIDKYKQTESVLLDSGTIREEYERRLRNYEKVNEVIFSLKPVLIKRAMRSLNGDMYFYCDADLFFFSRFDFDKVQEDIVLTEHIFKLELMDHVKNGKYNAGFVGFSKSPSSIICLNWWSEKCKESTAHDIENGVLGDQKYLECFSDLNSSIKVIKSPAMNQSVWMIDGKSNISKGPVIDGKKISSFHFHRLKPYKFLFKTGINQYGKTECREFLYKFIYLPYLKELAYTRDNLVDLNLSYPKIKLSELKRFEWSLK